MNRLFKLALPKGRLSEPVLKLFVKAGLITSEGIIKTRKLVIEDKIFSIIPLKPRDIPVLLQRGFADFGIIGDDLLREMNPDVDVCLDLNIGKAYFIIAGIPNTPYPPPKGFIKITTKYPRITEKIIKKEGLKGEIVTLYGSSEIATNLGISPYISDLTSTGKTLEENNLIPLKKFFKISAKLCVNRAVLRTNYREVKKIKDSLREVM